MSSLRCPEQRENELHNFRELFFPFAVETVFFGIYMTLAMFSTVHIWSKKSRARNDYRLMGTIVIMFATAVTHWTLHLILTWFSARNMALCAELPSSSTAMQVALNNLPVINFISSDSIVIWRAWILWGRPRWILVLNNLLGLLAITLALVNLIASIDTRISPALATDSGAAVLIASAVINIWGTSIVTYKAWEICREWKDLMGSKTSRRSFVTKALILVSASGMIYSVLWVIFACSEFHLLGEASAIVQTSMIQVTGIYPTLIILLVFLEEKHSERMQGPSDSSTLTWVVAS